MITPQEDIEYARWVESKAQQYDINLYMKCMNNLPMSERKTNQEIRDGCILTGVFVRIIDDESLG